MDTSLLTEHLSQSPFLEPDILDVVTTGIERYFGGDYVSAVHVLVPKLEKALRRTIGKLGVPQRPKRRKGLLAKNRWQKS